MRKINNMDIKVANILETLRREDYHDFLELVQNDKEFETVVKLFTSFENEYKNNSGQLTSLEPDSENHPNHDFADIKNYYKKYYVGQSLYTYKVQMEELVGKRCPICDCSFAYSQVTLDHILPKSKYPIYSIIPINLVPICYNCNMKKGQVVPKNVLHPYFHGFCVFDYLTISVDTNCKEPQKSRILLDYSKSSSEDEKFKESIELYKLRQKYMDLINLVFLGLMKQLEQIMSLERGICSINELKICLNSLDSLIENETDVYIDESFLRHLCIKALIEDMEFLNSLARDINKSQNSNNEFRNGISVLRNKLGMRKYFILGNDLELIRETLPMIKYVGIYQFEGEMLILKDFRGQFQDNEEVYQFKPSNQYLEHVIEEKTYYITESSLLSSVNPKNQIDVEIMIPIKQKKMFCMLLINRVFDIDEATIRETESTIQDLLSSHFEEN